MFHRNFILTFGAAFSLIFTSAACADRHNQHYDHSAHEAHYPDERTPSQGQFVGSIYFNTASSALSKAALTDLGRMATRIQDRRLSGGRVILIGYADRNRGVEENSELASERTQRVAIALEKRGVELERIVIDSRPVRTTRGRQGERRVDIYLEHGHHGSGSVNNLYPVLIGVFLLCTFGLAVLIFRRRR